MNIYFTGAQGTGKTTLAELLNKQMEGFTKIPSVTRNLIEKGELGTEETSKGATPATQKTIFDEYTRIFRADQNIISDRFLTDVLAYTKYIWHKDEDESALRELHREKDILDELAWEQGLMYGDAKAVVFYCPIEFAAENDGLRDTDEEYRKFIDTKIKQDLIGHAIKFCELHGTVEERMEQIKNYINRIMVKKFLK